MIDVKNYTERKEKGLISLAKLGSGLALSQKQYDKDTGEEIDPLVAGFHIADLEKMKLALEKTIADFDLLIADAKAL